MSATSARFDTESMTSVLQGWVARESPTHDAAAVNKMQDLVQAFFSVGSCSVERIPAATGSATRSR